MNCCDMTAGMLRHFIDLCSPSSTPDGQGGATVIFSKYATVRADLVPVSSREAVYLDSLRSPLVARATIRYRPDVEAGHVVRFGDELYQIRGTPRDVENRKRWLQLDLELRTAI